MIQSLILTTKILITFSYLIIGLYIIDITETRFEYWNTIDMLACIIGTIFIMFSFMLLYIFSCIKK
jgi:ABC-type spermidine/putrescine transport system permease subunit I